LVKLDVDLRFLQPRAHAAMSRSNVNPILARTVEQIVAIDHSTAASEDRRSVAELRG
jgi:hypothetical protein